MNIPETEICIDQSTSNNLQQKNSYIILGLRILCLTCRQITRPLPNLSFAKPVVWQKEP